MVTLTFRTEHGVSDRPEAVEAVQLFVKRLRRRVRGVRYLWVLELHPGGHGWHVHMLIDRWLPKDLLSTVWGHGFVDVRRVRTQKDGDSGTAAARRAAHYVAKYVAKSAQEAREAGCHRYERSQGMPITVVTAEAPYEVLWGIVIDRIAPTWVWRSSDAEEWRGPPCHVFRA
jgi:hypothetical protein